MEKAKEKINNFRNELQEIYSFIEGFVDNPDINRYVNGLIQFETLENYDQLKTSMGKMYEALDIIHFLISEKESTSARLSESPYTKTLNIGEFMKKMDVLANEIYKMARYNPELESAEEKAIRQANSIEDTYDYLGVEGDAFGFLNPEFLLPTEEFFTKDQLPKNASVVEMRVENTQNLIVMMEKVINSEKVKSLYPNLTPDSGATEELIDRFDMMQKFTDSAKDTATVPLNVNVVYQKLGDKYRKLIHYPDNDYVRNYKWLPISAKITNFENKRITMSRQVISKNQLYVNVPEKTFGLIKEGFVKKRKLMSDAIFDALYDAKMSDEQVTKLAISSYNLQDSLPKDPAIINKSFYSLITKKNLKNML